ncbi:GL11668 [Drosophila persimilis]|uniref:Beta-1,4-glucuronyltransferase 1 n=1 Tax=Drosophila persimilis TaxID=7234 RepID=B4GCS1_DROPE|nr:GL11668 [Drosophila persimilis]
MPLAGLDSLLAPNNTAPLAFDNADLSYGRWDSQHLYKIKDFALLGEQYTESSESSLVCLATQTSVERLNSLPQVATNWQGPMSVAVFSASHEEFVVLQYFVTYMRLCFPNIRENATFHLLTPPDYDKLPRLVSISFNLRGKFDCQYPDRTLKALLKLRSLKSLQWRQRNPYPQNHMRNLARKGCQTKWLSSNTNDTEVSISHVVTNFEFLYEPFYIAIDSAPAHDERFTGYGFTRNSQVYEMHIAGYQFYVLTPVFTGHWGLQRKQARPAWREQQNNVNRRKFDVFKSEIFLRYKNDPRLLLQSKKNQILIK